ncbi:PIR protein CIR protein [Plasmodium vinckei vinckei]|uniref:PIR protein CIR protein n=1 Tax=Plasmodium vinckei vinckei TaxID=54757 RepID=A0A449BS13_PLAVN|nr:PIR protein CIR protein [Plasmodium vinckei vinckei]VEV56193.1 PIR protein CIR protein [Plasmodium vinckei vinckei]
MAIKACELLREVDAYFNNGVVDEGKFDSNKSYFQYKCPYDKEAKELPGCKNNNERINALGGYLYNKLVNIANVFKGEGDNGNRHIEIFMMWLGDKLYKLENDKTAILEESYKNYLDNYTGNFKYWNIVGSKKEYKLANVWYMSELYNLLNCICNIVIEYGKNPNSREIGTMSKKCHQKFTSIYKDIKDCYSYFHLLKFLKNIYDGIRNDAIKRDNDLKDNIRKAAARRTAIISDTIKKANIPSQIKSSKELLKNVLNASTVSLIDLTPSDWNQRFPNDSDNITDFHTQKCVNSYHEFVEQVKKDISKDTPTVQSKPEPLSASQKSETSPQSGTKDSGTQKGNSDSKGGEKGGTKGESGSTGGGSGSETGDTSGGQSDQRGSPGGSDSQGGSSNQGGSGDGAKESGDQVPAHPSGAPNGYLPSNWGMNINLMSYMPNVSGIYQSSKDILTSATNQVSSAYNSAMIIAQDTYNKTVDIAKNTYGSVVSTVKDTYTRSTDYISGAVNSITIQLNPFGTSQLGDNKSGPNSLGGGVDTSNQSQTNPKQPINPPPPSLPPSPSPLQTSPDPSSPKPIDSQPILIHISKSSDQQIAPTDGNIGSQTPLPGQSTLASSGSNSLNTKNGNVISVENVKVKENSSIWCIAQNKKYDILGIGIISISIFAFLAIMYKYLSLGCTTKSKRKKSVKKVINSIGGKRPIQIIIKSYDRSKDLKPIINSVGRKKDSLLNIYKFMQADPIPFINLFFLLIFFVYKRQLNYLEL